MRVSFNALLLNPTGAGTQTFILGLLNGLKSIGAKEWIVYTRPGVPDQVVLPEWPGCSHIEIPIARTLPGRVFAELLLLPRYDTELRADVSYSPTPYLPLRQGIPAVATFLDFTARRVPRAYRLSQRISYRLRNERGLLAASGIATISETMRRQLEAAYSGRLTVPIVPILCGVDPEFARLGANGTQLSEPGRGREGRMVLATGGTDARKDIRTLARAFARLDAGLARRTQIVVTGPADAREVHRILETLPIDRRAQFTFTGFVSRKQFLEWMARARLMVFPTLDEGFGLPVLEAMAAGVPVLCSDLEVLHEVGGDTVEYFPAGDAELLATGLVRLCADGTRLQENIHRARERAKQFTWERSAERLSQLILQVKEGRR